MSSVPTSMVTLALGTMVGRVVAFRAARASFKEGYAAGRLDEKRDTKP